MWGATPGGAPAMFRVHFGVQLPSAYLHCAAFSAVSRWTVKRRGRDSPVLEIGNLLRPNLSPKLSHPGS